MLDLAPRKLQDLHFLSKMAPQEGCGLAIVMLRSAKGQELGTYGTYGSWRNSPLVGMMCGHVVPVLQYLQKLQNLNFLEGLEGAGTKQGMAAQLNR